MLRRGDAVCAWSPVADLCRSAQLPVFSRDLEATRTPFSHGNREHPFLQAFRPDRETIVVPVQNLQTIFFPVGEDVEMPSESIQLQIIANPAHAVHQNCAACLSGSGTGTLARWPAGESSAQLCIS